MRARGPWRLGIWSQPCYVRDCRKCREWPSTVTIGCSVFAGMASTVERHSSFCSCQRQMAVQHSSEFAYVVVEYEFTFHQLAPRACALGGCSSVGDDLIQYIVQAAHVARLSQI